jgi:hypothetical protein
MTAALVRAADRLIDQVSRWAPSRWTVPSASGVGTRADVTHALAQRLADLEAAVSGREPIPVPRLENDLALADQVRVMVLDLVAADPDPATIAAALDAIAVARREL